MDNYEERDGQTVGWMMDRWMYGQMDDGRRERGYNFLMVKENLPLFSIK